MINLYNSKTQDFSNNGISNLKDMIKCVITEELNGIYELEGEYPLLKGDNIDTGCILKVDSGYDQPQLFRIKRKVPNLKTVKLYANHISYDLKDNNLLDVYPQNLNGNNALHWILSKTQVEHKFTSFSDIDKVGTARYVNKNPIQALIGEEENSFVNIWGGEILRDNFMIKMLSQRGQDIGYKLTKTKNITGLEFDEDISQIVTRIIPSAYNGIKLPEIYIDSPIIENYPHPVIKEFEYSDIKLKDENSEEGFETIDELYDELRKRVLAEFNENNVDKPKINVKVNFVELSKTIEYKEYKNLETLHLGDYVTLCTDDYNIKLRVIKTKYDSLLHRYIEIELGILKCTFFDSYKQSMNHLKKEFQEKEFLSFLSAAKKDATKQIITAMGGYVYKTQNELYIMDSIDPKAATRIWRWNVNGLGYSKTGIDGPYETAITQDGKIVADFITTGKLNTNVIEGYSNLMLAIKEIQQDQIKQNKSISELNMTTEVIQQLVSGEYGMDREICGINQIHLPDALKYYPLELKISGYSNLKSILYPNNNVYPQNNLFPTNTDYPILDKITICVDKKSLISPTEKLKEYSVNIGQPLLSKGDIRDILNIYIDSSGNFKTVITRNLKEENGVIIQLDTPIIEELEPIKIELFEHENYIYIKEVPRYSIYAKYLVYSEINKYSAMKVELKSSIAQAKDSIISEVSGTYATTDDLIKAKSTIKQTTDEISLEVEKKVNKDKVIANINAAVKDKQGIIELLGNVVKIVSDNFTLDKDGSIKCKNGVFEGTIKANSGTIGGFSIEDNKLYSYITPDFDYNSEDVEKVRRHVTGAEPLPAQEIKKYDYNGDGVVDDEDFKMIARLHHRNVLKNKPGKIEINSNVKNGSIDFYDGNRKKFLSCNMFGIETDKAHIDMVATRHLYAGNMDCGSERVSTTANKITATTVYFNQPFDAVPVVVITPLTAYPNNNWRISVANITKEKFDIFFYDTAKSSATVSWVAMLDVSKFFANGLEWI